MPQFKYTAMDASGKEKKGKMDGANENAVANTLKQQGLFPTSIGPVKGTKTEAKKAAPLPGQKKKKSGSLLDLQIGGVAIKRKDLTVLTRQLSILLDAGLPLIRSLKTLERQTRNPAIRVTLEAACESVEGGSTFSEALSQHPKSFDKLYLNMIRAGEAAGAMETILDRLAMFLEKAARIAGKVKSAMIYPSVIMSVATMITVGLMVFIVPNFKKIFDELLAGEPLPGLTNMVIGFSDILRERAWIVLVWLAIAVVIFLIVRKIPAGRYVIDWLKYNMPLLGPIISKTAIGRFARTLGTLLSSGVPVLNALTIVKDTAGNELVTIAVQKVHEAVKEGEGIAKPLGATKVFPEMVISMIEVGEETGKLPEMLEKVADTYDEEVDNAVSALTSLIEPIMIVGLAVVIGTIVIAMFLPLVKIIEKLS
jgi:type IV pilus assembly protein PilC